MLEYIQDYIDAGWTIDEIKEHFKNSMAELENYQKKIEEEQKTKRKQLADIALEDAIDAIIEWLIWADEPDRESYYEEHYQEISDFFKTVLQQI